jgi:hypothetical protein
LTENYSWIKASASNHQGECVEVQRADDAVLVRDSTDPDGPTLRFTPGEFAAWIDGAKKGEFDHLTVTAS